MSSKMFSSSQSILFNLLLSLCLLSSTGFTASIDRWDTAAQPRMGWGKDCHSFVLFVYCKNPATTTTTTTTTMATTTSVQNLRDPIQTITDSPQQQQQYPGIPSTSEVNPVNTVITEGTTSSPTIIQGSTTRPDLVTVSDSTTQEMTTTTEIAVTEDTTSTTIDPSTTLPSVADDPVREPLEFTTEPVPIFLPSITEGSVQNDSVVTSNSTSQGLVTFEPTTQELVTFESTTQGSVTFESTSSDVKEPLEFTTGSAPISLTSSTEGSVQNISVATFESTSQGVVPFDSSTQGSLTIPSQIWTFSPILNESSSLGSTTENSDVRDPLENSTVSGTPSIESSTLLPHIHDPPGNIPVADDIFGHVTTDEVMSNASTGFEVTESIPVESDSEEEEDEEELTTLISLTTDDESQTDVTETTVSKVSSTVSQDPETDEIESEESSEGEGPVSLESSTPSFETNLHNGTTQSIVDKSSTSGAFTEDPLTSSTAGQETDDFNEETNY